MAGFAWIPTVYASKALGSHSGVVGSLGAELEQPRFYFRDLKLTAKLELERGIEAAYIYDGGRAKLGVGYEPTNHLTITPSYNLELYHLEAGSAQLGRPAPALLFGCPTNCVLSYVEALIQWDVRENEEPHRGYYLALALQEGGGIWAGASDTSASSPRLVPTSRSWKRTG